MSYHYIAMREWRKRIKLNDDELLGNQSQNIQVNAINWPRSDHAASVKIIDFRSSLMRNWKLKIKAKKSNLHGLKFLLVSFLSKIAFESYNFYRNGCPLYHSNRKILADWHKNCLILEIALLVNNTFQKQYIIIYCVAKSAIWNIDRF